MNDAFHEAVLIEMELQKSIQPGRLNRVLKGLGATLDYDVYSFYRDDDYPEWQSDIYMMLTLSHGGKEVDAQGSVDCITLDYPMASIGAEYINQFADKSFEISKELQGTVRAAGKELTKETLIELLESIAGEIMSEWGEEPGSEVLAMMIENSYGK